jgi:hypothetical protein
MHSSGDYVSNGSEFSSSKWHAVTELYTDKIQNNLTADNWTAIFKALHRLEESNIQDSQIQTGAPPIPIQCQALLPDDPPTPPSFN